MKVLDGALDAVGDDHRPRFAADLALGQHLIVEAIHHDLGLDADCVVVTLDETPEILPGFLDVEHRVVLHANPIHEPPTSIRYTPLSEAMFLPCVID